MVDRLLNLPAETGLLWYWPVQKVCSGHMTKCSLILIGQTGDIPVWRPFLQASGYERHAQFSHRWNVAGVVLHIPDGKLDRVNLLHQFLLLEYVVFVWLWIHRQPAENNKYDIETKTNQQTKVHIVLTNRWYPVFKCAATMKATNCFPFLFALSARQIWVTNRIPHSLDFEFFTRNLPHNLCDLHPFSLLTFWTELTFDHWSFESHSFVLLFILVLSSWSTHVHHTSLTLCEAFVTSSSTPLRCVVS